MKKLKLKIICLVLVLLSVFSVTCLAATPSEHNMELSFDDGYVVITQANISEYTEIIEKMGYSKKSFQSLFVDGSLVAFILHSESKSQIQIKVIKTQFSQETKSLSYIKEEKIAQVAEKISPDYSRLLLLGDTYFICTDKNINDESGKYSASQFSTVENGKLYTITIFNNNPTYEFNVSVLKKINIKAQVKRSGVNDTLYDIFFLVSIIAVLGLIIYLIISTISSFREKEDNDVREFVRIKRRRF